MRDSAVRLETAISVLGESLVVVEAVVETGDVPLWQRRAVMACAVLGVVLSNLDSAIANIALPTIARELAASPAATVWVVNSYQLAVTICLLPAAACSEILGLKRVYAFGLIVFTIASLACALAQSLDVLVAARVVQGIGGSCVAALGPGLVRLIYPRRLIGGGLALIALSVAVAGAVGPTVASLILSVATWPWLFLVNLPVGLVAVPLFLIASPLTPGRKHPFDMAGALLSAVALGLLVVGVGGLGSHPRLAISETLAGLAGLALLVWHQARRPLPLLPLDLMRIPIFALSAGTSACAYAAQILAYISLPFLFQTEMHRSAVETGLLVTPWPVLVAISAPIAGRLTARHSPLLLGTIGLVVMMIGLVALIALPADPAVWDIAWRMALCGIGFGFYQTPNNMVMMTAGPIARNNAASGMMAFSRVIGWSLGSALVALIFAVRGTGGTTACLVAAVLICALGAGFSIARLAGRRP
jgi:DHA2 family multidrug resistance protein-like MFS transporter